MQAKRKVKPAGKPWKERFFEVKEIGPTPAMTPNPLKKVAVEEVKVEFSQEKKSH